MRSNIIYALVLLGAVVGVQAQECKGNDQHCGCVGDGGGDGAYCGTASEYATDFCYQCPVKN
ncbi:hypothetical protein SLS58_008235 [Diplodia intermedia]|uniref:Uncharacterized protein n=1 Tax=Diplodia intermedia TaxID=856260 RepID=A0ABR3TI17_9PEZI